jgi:hypothetical protein
MAPGKKLTHYLLSIMDVMGNFKITDAQETKMISNFKGAKQKLLKNNAAIWFRTFGSVKCGSVKSVG